MEQVKVTIDEMGNATIEVSGVVGKRCKDITKPLEDALGGVVISDNLKSEYHQQPTAAHVQHRR